TMNLAFQPQNDMNLSPVEMAVAAYVFCRDLPPVDVGDCIANRAALMTLVLRGEVMDDVGSKCCRPYAHKDFKTNSMVPPHKHHASRTRRPYADLRHCHLALEQLHAVQGGQGHQ
ncbi:hypothetical protein S245_005529, partial [Arachis hypogaea]